MLTRIRIIGSVSAALSLFLVTSTPIQGQSEHPSALPLLHITTDGATIPDEPKIPANMRITFPGETGEPVQRTWIAIEQRGSSSKRFPKKGYGFETRRKNGEDRDLDLLGLGKEEDWVLHGPYSDKTLIRNALAYRLAESLTTWAPGVRLVELKINEDYRGVYLLTEKIKRDRNRVPLEKVGNKGVDLTGGYLLKIDKSTGEREGVATSFSSRYRDRKTGNPPVNFQYHYPKPEDMTEEQRDYITNWMHDFEAVLSGEDWLDPDRGYHRMVDLPSFVDYFLLNELSRNVDGFRISTYFHKNSDREGGKLRMGPVWDFNIAFGNADYCRANQPRGWAYVYNNRCGGENWPLPFWWRRMMEDPDFVRLLRERWTVLRSGPFGTEALHAQIDEMVEEMGSAVARNEDRWRVIGKTVWPNAYVGRTYRAEIDFLKDWMTKRSEWMDAAIAELAVSK